MWETLSIRGWRPGIEGQRGEWEVLEVELTRIFNVRRVKLLARE